MRRMIVVIALVAVSLAACGKKGPLIYPEMTAPAAVNRYAVRQSGDDVLITFAKPDRDLSGRPVQDLAGFKVFRRVLGAIETVSDVCGSCREDYQLLRKLYLDLPAGLERSGDLYLVQDAGTVAGIGYGYYLVAFNQVGMDGQATPAKGLIRYPSPSAPQLTIRSYPTELRLEISAAHPASGTISGYNIYRAVKGDVLPIIPLNREPVAAGSFYLDTELERGVEYWYTVRLVVRMPSGQIVEGLRSGPVAGMLVDE